MDASNISIPCYWANTSKQDLPGPASDYAYVRSIYVSGGTVYSGGWINNGSLQIPCYWEGTERKTLYSDEGFDAYVNAIFVK
ncbi:MAG TPA: hypothetical protein PKN50_18855 [Spirochaetota bacterium]|nr:hypothetical protein [Spirochaetota bacterium]